MFNNFKPYNKKFNRIKNPKLCESYRSMSCILLGATSGKEDKCYGLVVGHHIKSVGSGGHDLPTNLIPLCEKHHEEIHKGLNKFTNKYPKISIWLTRNGWSFNTSINKWREDRNEGGAIV
jgi:hypothetical protein